MFDMTQRTRSRQSWLCLVAIGASLVALLVFVAAVGPPGQFLLGVLLSPFIGGGGADVLTVNPAWLMVALALGVAVILAALRWGHPSRPAQVVMVMALGATISLPWVAQYRPRVLPTAGYVLHWATDPGPFGRTLRALHQSLEVHGCRYRLVEWRDDVGLVYEAHCGTLDGVTVWAYEPESGNPARQLTGRAPSAADPSLLFDPPQLTGNFYAFHPLASPDGRWLAYVVGWYYKPEEVMVVSARPVAAIDRMDIP